MRREPYWLGLMSGMKQLKQEVFMEAN